MNKDTNYGRLEAPHRSPIDLLEEPRSSENELRCGPAQEVETEGKHKEEVLSENEWIEREEDLKAKGDVEFGEDFECQ